MTTVVSTLTSSRHVKAPAVQATGWVSVVAKMFRTWRNRRMIVGLVNFDDKMLADIGLTRGDVVASLSGSAMIDPSDHLTALANERRQSIRATARDRLAEAAGDRSLPMAAE